MQQELDLLKIEVEQLKQLVHHTNILTQLLIKKNNVKQKDIKHFVTQLQKEFLKKQTEQQMKEPVEFDLGGPINEGEEIK